MPRHLISICLNVAAACASNSGSKRKSSEMSPGLAGTSSGVTGNMETEPAAKSLKDALVASGGIHSVRTKILVNAFNKVFDGAPTVREMFKENGELNMVAFLKACDNSSLPASSFFAKYCQQLKTVPEPEVKIPYCSALGLFEDFIEMLPELSGGGENACGILMHLYKLFLAKPEMSVEDMRRDPMIKNLMTGIFSIDWDALNFETAGLPLDVAATRGRVGTLGQITNVLQETAEKLVDDFVDMAVGDGYGFPLLSYIIRLLASDQVKANIFERIQALCTSNRQRDPVASNSLKDVARKFRYRYNALFSSATFDFCTQAIRDLQGASPELSTKLKRRWSQAWGISGFSQLFVKMEAELVSQIIRVRHVLSGTPEMPLRGTPEMPLRDPLSHQQAYGMARGSPEPEPSSTSHPPNMNPPGPTGSPLASVRAPLWAAFNELWRGGLKSNERGCHNALVLFNLIISISRVLEILRWSQMSPRIHHKFAKVLTQIAVSRFDQTRVKAFLTYYTRTRLSSESEPAQ